MKPLTLAAALLLAACGTMPQTPQTPLAPADPAIVAKVNYVCAWSGLFKFATSAAASVVPVPGVPLAADLVNAGVDQICLHPELVAADEAVVAALIGQFKAAGRM